MASLERQSIDDGRELDPLSSLLNHLETPPPPITAAANAVPDDVRSSGAADHQELPNEAWEPFLGKGNDPGLLKGERLCLDRIECNLQSYHGVILRGKLIMTNYQVSFVPSHENAGLPASEAERCCLHLGSGYLRLPLSLVSSIEVIDSSKSDIVVTMSTKDCRAIRFIFPRKEEATSAVLVIGHYVYSPTIQDLFCFEHSHPAGLDQEYSLEKEFTRQGALHDDGPWKLTSVNRDFHHISSYPEELVVHKNFSDEEVICAAAFRSEGRLPVLTWAGRDEMGSIWRSSQPKIGVHGGQCKEDEKLLSLVASTGKQGMLHVVDCRPKASARANQLTGHGVERSGRTIAVAFMNSQNIHAVRDSYQQLEKLSLSTNAKDPSWGKLVEDTGWLQHIRLLLNAGLQVAERVHSGSPVLVHCSHGIRHTCWCYIYIYYLQSYSPHHFSLSLSSLGWDRTPSVTGCHT